MTSSFASDAKEMIEILTKADYTKYTTMTSLGIESGYHDDGSDDKDNKAMILIIDEDNRDSLATWT